MPEIIETTVYRLGELSDAAKERPALGIVRAASTMTGTMPSMKISSVSPKSSG